MSEIVLELKNISKVFGKQKVLDNIHLTIRKGDIYGLIGRNGAGKTTIMKIITDLISPTEGKVFLLSSRPYTKNLERVGAIIESPVAYVDFSAYENLKILCMQKGIHDYSVIEEALQFVNLTGTGKKKFKNFSLGMKQRLGIAMALINNPDFIILDEPINGLDPIAIIEFREILQKINHEKNITILISGHILTELYLVSNRFGFIHNGKLIEEITKRELDEKCSSTIEIRTKQLNELAAFLEHLGAPFKVLNDNHLQVKEKLIASAELNQQIVQKGILIDEIRLNDENLEEYYTNLIMRVEGLK
ncbi:ATP-binding cassette domain-containing protein [Bacillus paramycoides]|uniref:ATP-binding cassette domain-containing protein n=1 Tax=Bacillus paramycoides TaxID=2026194 RepID=UPI0022437B3E|nr:ATP-binding cassette domain-containing protein [Bacillus paramycoides]MCW9134074.1 ATP-binding cassette domain-containing protein [Bacillus paramycoides]